MCVKRNVLIYIFLLIIVFSYLPVHSQENKSNYPPVIPDAKIEMYKIINDIKLNLWIIYPKDHKDTDSRAAIVFFFGGGWKNGNPKQFVPQCKYLADRGMVAMVADYRVRSRHNVSANKCVEDAKSAVRYIRQNAARLGIDPDRIAASGGSAGGHLAAATATLPNCNDPADDFSVNPKPNALVLFNPAVILASVPGQYDVTPEKAEEWRKRLGVEPELISPYHHITENICPTIIFHGTKDKIVPYKTVELFREKMQEKHNRCELVGYYKKGHGFFNSGWDSSASYIDTIYKMDHFLCSIGYLKSPPESIHYK